AAPESIGADIGAIDRKLTAQMNEILHHPTFQKLEGTWRGLQYLVRQTNTGEHLRLWVLNVTKDELVEDFKKAIEFDLSQTVKKASDEEYGTLGGFPYGMLLGDYEFNCRSAADVELLRNLSGIAAAAHAPFVAAVSPQSFDMDRFSELAGPRDLAALLPEGHPN